MEIESSSLPEGIVGQSYSFELQSDCGGDLWFLSNGNLPPGISLENDGDLVGTPVLAGVFVFTVGLEDSFNGELVFKGFSINVREP